MAGTLKYITVKPDKDTAAKYDEKYAFYHKLYPAIKTVL